MMGLTPIDSTREDKRGHLCMKLGSIRATHTRSWMFVLGDGCAEVTSVLAASDREVRWLERHMYHNSKRASARGEAPAVVQ